MNILHPKVSIIIVNYNGLKHTLDCLRSLEKISFSDKEIIVYDNGSVKDPSDDLRKRFPHVRIFHRRKNIGYCGGINKAIRYARGTYVLLLNNDTIVTKDFLTILVQRIEKQTTIAIVQPKLIFLKTKKLQAGCSFFTYSGLLYYYGYGKNPRDKKYNVPMPMYTVNGACMLIRQSIIQKIGLFDKDFFLYFEETDFCHRALVAGYDVWYEPAAEVYHIGAADNSRYKYAALMYNAFKNRIQSYLKNLGPAYLLGILPVHMLFCTGSIIIYFVTGRPESSLSVIRAIWYNIRNFKHIMRKRNHIQKVLRAREDYEFLPKVTKNPRVEYYAKLFTGLESYSDHL